MTFFQLLCIVLGVLLLASGWALSYVTRGRVRTVSTLVLIAVDLVALLAFFLGGKHPEWHLADHAGVPDALQVLTVVFMAQVVLVTLVVAGVLVRWGYRHRPGRRKGFLFPSTPFDPSRRRLLKGAAAFPVVAFGAGFYGEAIERNRTVVREYSVPVRSLPDSVQGLRIAQLSDVHIGMFYPLERLEKLLEKTVAQKPDLIAITGDLFDDDHINAEAAALLGRFTDRVPHGIWFVLGNHEHFRNLPRTLDALKETQVHLLVNRAEAVEGVENLWIVGTDFPMNRNKEIFQKDKAMMAEKAFEHVPEDVVRIYLGHHPESIDDGAAHGAAITLTGHTHGSQFGVLGMPVFPVFKYTRGFVHIGGSTGYVHSGNGSWFPCRIGCPPEIAVFTLRQA